MNAFKNVLRIFSLLTLAVLISSCMKGGGEVVEIRGQTMGSYYLIKYIPGEGSIPKEEAAKKIEGVLTWVNGFFNHYNPESTLSQFNLKRDTEWMEVDEKFIFVLSMNKDMSERVEGAFDPTIFPIVRAYGFAGDHRGKSEKRIPSDDEIAKLLKSVGISKIEIDEKGKRVRKLDPNLEMEFGASVPGLAADDISWTLKNVIKSKDFLIDVGGEMHIEGTHNGSPWRVAIEAPQEGNERVIERIIEITDVNLATSGNYRNFIKNEGKRLGHILDARTGKSAPSDILSVTVLDKHGAFNADLWSTALMSIGIRNAYFLAEKFLVPAYFIYEVESPDGTKQIKTRQTSAMKAYTNSETILGKLEELVK